jgi:hypothetical protein
VLRVADAEPELFGNFARGGATALWYGQLVLRIRKKLPRQHAGTYVA